MMKHNYKGILVLALSAAVTMLSAQPAIEWGKRYNAPPDQADEALDIAVDPSGNVYVTGSAFNSSGNLDAVTIKYDASGNQVWVRNYDRGVGGNDLAYSIELDAAGNVYIVGFSNGTTTSGDALTVKYDNSGTQQWASFYDGFGYMDEAKEIAVDASGNVFICGYTSDANQLFNTLTVGYNSAGTQQWAQTYAGPGNNNDELLDLIIDGSSNVYVTGSTADSIGVADILTIKYNSAGVQQWLQTRGSPTDGDFGKAITLDPSGNVLVGSQSGLQATSNWFDYLTVKYSNAGVFQWEARYNNGTNRYEDLWEICTDNAGYVYVTGQSQAIGSQSTPPDAATVKYTPAGNQVWVQRFDGGFSNKDDRAYAMALDDTANVYIAGYSKNATNNDFIIVKYDSAGTLEYNLRYNSQYNQAEQINAMAVQNGNIYVTGRSANAANEDFLTMKYSYAAVGIQEQAATGSAISVYPNPASDVLNFGIAAGTDPASTVIITDLTGREIMKIEVSGVMNSQQINISALASGAYLLNHIAADGSLLSSQKITKK